MSLIDHGRIAVSPSLYRWYRSNYQFALSANATCHLQSNYTAGSDVNSDRLGSIAQPEGRKLLVSAPCMLDHPYMQNVQIVLNVFVNLTLEVSTVNLLLANLLATLHDLRSRLRGSLGRGQGLGFGLEQ
jgi:hypothetical protein